MTQCPTCGAGLEAGNGGRCRKCGTTIQPQPVAPAPFPVQTVTPFQQQQQQPGGMPNQSFAYLGPYYDAEFQQIRRSNEAYKGRWNWAAFFFGPLWAASKGLWVNAIVCFLAACVLVAPTFGLGGIIVAVVYGLRGNYFYYSKVVNGKDLAF